MCVVVTGRCGWVRVTVTTFTTVIEYQQIAFSRQTLRDHVEMMLTDDPSQFAKFFRLGKIRSDLPYDFPGFLADDRQNICISRIKDQVVRMESLISRIVPFVLSENRYAVNVHPVTTGFSVKSRITEQNIFCSFIKIKFIKMIRSPPAPQNISFPVHFDDLVIDQFFIGRSVGELGNAATNVAFPLTISCVALALLFGIGGAASFNLTLGGGDREKALFYIGNAATLLFGSGVILGTVALFCLTPMLRFFGSPDNVLAYAKTYTGITALGFPFLILTNGGGHLVRADGSPLNAMLYNLSGALINTVLDPLFIFGLHMGMAGAALATIIGQIFSGILIIRYLRRYKNGRLTAAHLRPQRTYVSMITSLGAAAFFNQLAMLVVQIVLNKSLTYYGAHSDYGESIPLACAGIITKVNQVFFSIVIGLSQGMQPIASFNYGAKNYARVRQVYGLALRWGFAVSAVSFACFQLIPRPIIGLFGEGSEMYFQFAEKYFRIYLFFTFLNCVQPIASNLFTAIGKPKKGIFLSLTRQILFLLPLIVILPLFIGIDGIMYAGPIADFVAGVVALAMAGVEVRRLRRMESASVHA